MRFKNLSSWLEWLETLHNKKIDYELTRVKRVAKQLNLLSLPCPVITVTGTNGKGSCVAILESIYLANGYTVGCYTSPHLFHFNERIKLNGHSVNDEKIIESFAELDWRRDQIPLTYFEFTTLAALLIFAKAKPDVILLEVGLGGRLDAVNVVDSDLAIITSIGLDHSHWLGHDRTSIAREKAGIFRPHKAGICGDANPPTVITQIARDLNTTLLCQGREFSFTHQRGSWTFCYGSDYQLSGLPYPQLHIQNAATALMAVYWLRQRLAVANDALIKGLAQASLPARIQIVPGPITHILDVAHNPQAVELLAEKIKQLKLSGKIIVIFSMLKDKDITAAVSYIAPLADQWMITEVPSKRSASIKVLANSLQKNAIVNYCCFENTADAYQACIEHAQNGDTILAFGSFYLISPIAKKLGLIG